MLYLEFDKLSNEWSLDGVSSFQFFGPGGAQGGLPSDRGGWISYIRSQPNFFVVFVSFDTNATY